MVAAFSDPHAGPPGYAALIADAGAYEDGSRVVFHVIGDHALKTLNGLVTADLLNASGNRAHPTLILTPKGKILADAIIVHFDDDVWLDVPAEAWPGLEAHLGRYLPPRLARLERSEMRVVRIHGPRATQHESTDPVLASLNGPTYTQRDGSHWAVASFRGGFAMRPPEGFDLYLPPDADHELGLDSVSDDAWNIWRIERGIALFGSDYSDVNLPQETDFVPERVSFEKGCYTGQETVARIQYRGHVNRHLRGLRTVGAPEYNEIHRGDPIWFDDKVVGEITSAELSPVHGWIGLGYVRREVEPGVEVTISREPVSEDMGIRATIESLPFAAP
jgi:folate-binding protein YgfZ